MRTTQRRIGFYPIVDSYAWIEKLIPLGVPSIQLRMKGNSMHVIEEHIIKSIALAKRYACQLFINDYWQLALKHQSFGVHLGQEDVVIADTEAIHAAGLHLGISTHNTAEIEYALQYNPSYIAYGPIYATQTKKMNATPRGLDRLEYWVKRMNLPIVAIGGINLSRAPGVIQTGADGIAVVSAVTQADDYQAAVQHFMDIVS